MDSVILIPVYCFFGFVCFHYTGNDVKITGRVNSDTEMLGFYHPDTYAGFEQTELFQ